MSSDAPGVVEIRGHIRDDLVRHHLARLHPLNQLTEEALTRLMPSLRLVRYPANTPLYAIGDSPADNFYVLTGCVCLYDRDGPQMTIRPGRDQDAITLPFGVPSDDRAQVVESSVILQVNRALIGQVTQRGGASAVADRSVPVQAASAQPEAPAAAASAIPEQASATEKERRVLLVEHQPADASSGRELLKSMGVRTDWARSAEEAIELLQIEEYRAVLLDLQLPDGDAFDVVKAVRQLGVPRPTLIAMAELLNGDREGCLAAGMDDVICKPLSADVVRANLALGGPRSSQRRVRSGIAV